ncbi:MAG: hypothetical protein GXP42_02535 [Chloroflexi bacterium]|nr:hypothetical protein [Chloroflexota bacterium]
MDPDLWQQTVDIAVEFKVLENPPDAGAYRTDLAEKALAGLSGDVTGENFQKIEVEITPGGE